LARVLTIGAKGDGQALPGALEDALPYGDGSHVIGTHQDGLSAQLLRVTPSSGAIETLGAKLRSTDKLLEVSADGTHMLVRFIAEHPGDAGGAELVDTRTGKATELRLRYVASGAVSPDGNEALVSGISVDCVATSLNDCPMPMWRLEAGGTVTLVRGGTDVVSNYQASYLRDGRVALQTTARTGCHGTNACRHDIIVVPRDNLGAPGTVIREDGYGPAFSPAGDRMAYLVYDTKEAKCTKLPCQTADLFTMPQSGGAPRRIASAQVSRFSPHAFSSDGKWLVYGGASTALFSCSVDDARCQPLGAGQFAGWIR
jgi:hypothetical protein